MAQDSPAALASLANLLDRGHDLRAFCAEVVEYIRNLLVAAVVPGTVELRGLIETSEDDLNQLSMNAKTLTPEQLQELLAIFIQAEDSLRFSSHPRFVMETAAVRATRLLRQREGSQSRPIQTASSSNQKPPAEPERRKSGPSAPSALRQGTPVASKPIPKPTPTSRGKRMKATIYLTIHNPPADVAQPPSRRASHSRRSTTDVALGIGPRRDCSLISQYCAVPRSRQVCWDRGWLCHHRVCQAGNRSQSEIGEGRESSGVIKIVRTSVGISLRVRIIELTETHPPGPTMAQVRAAKEQEQRLVLFERAKANPTVKQALEIFGVELAEVRTITQQEAGE